MIERPTKIPVLYGQYDDEGNPLWMDDSVRQLLRLRAKLQMIGELLNEYAGHPVIRMITAKIVSIR